jgi:periplasmic divalent cation tolerance protein
MNTEQPIIISSTFLDPKVAQEVVFMLIEKKLIACAQFFNIESHFVWDGKFERVPETLVQLKTLASLYKEVEKTIINCHPYQVPEVIATPITNISEPYLQWMLMQLGKENSTKYV